MNNAISIITYYIYIYIHTRYRSSKSKPIVDGSETSENGRNHFWNVMDATMYFSSFFNAFFLGG